MDIPGGWSPFLAKFAKKYGTGPYKHHKTASRAFHVSIDKETGMISKGNFLFPMYGVIAVSRSTLL